MSTFKFIIILMITPIAILSLMIIANSLGYFDWGTVPDWLSLLTNICTVLITLTIAKRAKKFLDEKVHSEGLARGYKLLDTIDEIADVLSSLMMRTINNDRVVQIASKPEQNYDNYSLSSAISNADKIYKDAYSSLSKLDNVSFMIKRLGRWHIQIKHQNDFNQFIKTCREFLNYILYISGHNSELEYPDTSYSTSEVRKIIPMLSVIHADVENNYDKILALKFKDIFIES
ncbi:hypothetical protein [Pantoea eucalypti]|uniref:hypothetical protein n=1 Tax=Pantoea eucalypti TaxID=470933 RepID=UPI00099AF8BD|nr:hypothetical protein [Pantoea eucalypti]SJZ36311.1 hypothetical protein SAMN03097723_0759 [Pantoea eucalypti]